jgi:hypothetical protein
VVYINIVIAVNSNIKCLYRIRCIRLEGGDSTNLLDNEASKTVPDQYEWSVAFLLQDLVIQSTGLRFANATTQ